MMSAWLLSGALAAGAAPDVEGRAVPAFADRVSARSFLKGCLHSHSNDHAERSYEKGKGDGDVSPSEVLAAYASRGYAFPGQAWVQAWAPSSSAEDLCAALKAGRFYSSSGPELAALTVDGDSLALEVEGAWDPNRDRVEFIVDGKVAAQSRAPAASYTLKGGEGYVRARVTQGGKRAWTQAYRVR